MYVLDSSEIISNKWQANDVPIKFSDNSVHYVRTQEVRKRCPTLFEQITDSGLTIDLESNNPEEKEFFLEWLRKGTSSFEGSQAGLDRCWTLATTAHTNCIKELTDQAAASTRNILEQHPHLFQHTRVKPKVVTEALSAFVIGWLTHSHIQVVIPQLHGPWEAILAVIEALITEARMNEHRGMLYIPKEMPYDPRRSLIQLITQSAPPNPPSSQASSTSSPSVDQLRSPLLQPSSLEFYPHSLPSPSPASDVQNLMCSPQGLTFFQPSKDESFPLAQSSMQQSPQDPLPQASMKKSHQGLSSQSFRRQNSQPSQHSPMQNGTSLPSPRSPYPFPSYALPDPLTLLEAHSKGKRKGHSRSRQQNIDLTGYTGTQNLLAPWSSKQQLDRLPTVQETSSSETELDSMLELISRTSSEDTVRQQ